MSKYDDYLAHHGILGQKWGVRRFQNPDGTLTNLGKQRYLKAGTHGTFMGSNRDQDIRIKKGTESYRVQQKLNSSYKDGHVYTTFDPEGHFEYLYSTFTTAGDDLGLFNGAFNNDKIKGYSVTLKLTDDLIMPSYEKSIDAFLRTVKNVGMKEVANTVNMQYAGGYKAKDFIKDMKHLTVEECRDRAYQNFIRKVTVDERLRKEFFNDLKAQGYNAIVDENDYHFGNNPYSGAPVIIFEKSKNVKQRKARAITSARADEIQKLFESPNEINYKDILDKWDSEGRRSSNSHKRK